MKKGHNDGVLLYNLSLTFHSKGANSAEHRARPATDSSWINEGSICEITGVFKGQDVVYDTDKTDLYSHILSSDSTTPTRHQ